MPGRTGAWRNPWRCRYSWYAMLCRTCTLACTRATPNLQWNVILANIKRVQWWQTINLFEFRWEFRICSSSGEKRKLNFFQRVEFFRRSRIFILFLYNWTYRKFTISDRLLFSCPKLPQALFWDFSRGCQLLQGVDRQPPVIFHGFGVISVQWTKQHKEIALFINMHGSELVWAWRRDDSNYRARVYRNVCYCL